MVSPDVPQVEDGWRDQLSNDKVRIIAKFPEIPVGGRLSLFMNEWKKITDDKWVLEIIQKGYKLEFLKKPAFGGIKHTRVPPDQIELISLEIESLLKKNAIEKVSTKNAKAGFYSTLFLVAKNSGEMRPVINLRPLNKYLRKLHFKMDTLCKVLDLVQTGDWGLTLDLKDAYFHIKVFKKHRKYLRFCFQNQVYQFRALCFGPTVSPRVFTKVVAVVTAHLHRQNIRLASYLDDWLAVNQLRRMLLQNRDVILNLLFHLGFVVNKDKSNLVPTQKLTYIGGLFHLNTGLVYPTETRVKNLKKAIKMILKGHRTARQFLVLLGQIASCLQLIPNARLFMRPIQLHLLKHWSPVRMDMSVKIPLTPQLGLHLNWWLQDQNILKGYCFQPRSYLVTLTTDASLWGWGAHLNGYLVQGRWSKLQSLRHVNLFELEGVFLAVKHFLPFLKNQNVLIRTDNTTVMHYINKQGGTRSRPLWHMSWDLWNLVLKNNMQIKAAHIMGKREWGMGPKELSREQSVCSLGTAYDRSFCDSGEQESNAVLFMDSIPTCICAGCPIGCMGEHVCICIPSDSTYSQSTLSHETVPVYCNTDSTLLASSAVVSNISQSADSKACQTSMQSGSSVSESGGGVTSRTRDVELDGMDVVDRHLSTKGFSSKTRQLLSASWRKGTKRDYNCKFRQFGSWCDSQKVDPLSPSLVDCAHFVTFLFEKGLKYKTITGYRSMLSSILPRVEGFPIGQHPHIIRLLKGIFNERPPLKKLVPEWDLCLVLGCLRKPPFEPLKDASLKHVTWKTCFLVAITTLRRCSDLQSLQLGEETVNVQRKGVTFIRTGMAKQDRPSHDSSNIFVPALLKISC